MGNIRGGMNGFLGTIGQPTAQVIDGSLKIKSGSYLSRTFGTGNSTTWTFSCWVKRATLGTTQYLFRTPTVDEGFYLSTSDKIDIYRYSGSFTYFGSSIRTLRDTKGWQHIVYAHDSNAESGNRLRLYVNNVLQELTSLSDIGSGNNYSLNSAVAHRVGEIDGYMGPCYFVDGLSLGPGYFGFIDPLTNTWRPKKFRAEGTTINDGTVWSNSLTTNAGDNFDGSGAKTKAFDGNGSNKAFTANNSDGTTQGTSYLEMVFPSPISGALRVKCDNGNTVRNTTGGRDVILATQSTGSDNKFVDCGTVSGLTNLRVLMSGGSRPAISIIEVDGVIMQDSTTTNLSFGTNGFYLPMDNEERFHLDQSGNNNHFTKNSFSGTSIDPDVVKDSPSGAVFGGRGQTGITTTSSAPGNYATLNPLDNIGATLSNGNLTITDTSVYYRTIFGTQTSFDGKHYFEVDVTTLGTTMGVGIFVGNDKSAIDANNYAFDANTYVVMKNGSIYHDGSTYSYQSSYGAGDTVGVAIDSKNKKVWLSKNGTYVSGENPTTGSGGMQSVSGVGAIPDGDIYPMVMIRNATVTANFGQKPFKYAPPQGYSPMNSATARPNKVVPRPDQYVGIVTYKGSSTENQIISDTGTSLVNGNLNPPTFNPDFIWVADRVTSGGAKWVFDSVRGSNKYLQTNGTGAEGTRTFTINNNGVSIPANDGSYNLNSSKDYVALCWKAGGSSNTFNIDDVGYASAAAAGLDGGTITPVGASVGTKQGFSIVNFQGTGATASFSHGLEQAPDFMICKSDASGPDWGIYHRSVGKNKILYFTTAKEATSTNAWDDTHPTDSLVYLGANGTTNQGGANSPMIYYIWHDVPGLQKFGKYTGRGSADGPFVELGFRPAVLIWKKLGVDGGNWNVEDSARSPINPVILTSRLNTNEADLGTSQGNIVELLSNGFKVRNTSDQTNSSGVSYIYMAWAEQPAFNLFGGQSNAR